MSVHVLNFEFKSVKKACEFFGMDRGTVHTRMKKQGMTLEEALLTPLRMDRQVSVRGIEFKSLAEACRAFGAVYSTVYYRIVYEQMEAERAILLEKKRDKPITLEGVDYKNLTAAYKEYDISYVTVHDRKVKGLGLKEAIMQPVVRTNIKIELEDNNEEN